MCLSVFCYFSQFRLSDPAATNTFCLLLTCLFSFVNAGLTRNWQRLFEYSYKIGDARRHRDYSCITVVSVLMAKTQVIHKNASASQWQQFSDLNSSIANWTYQH